MQAPEKTSHPLWAVDPLLPLTILLAVPLA